MLFLCSPPFSFSHLNAVCLPKTFVLTGEVLNNAVTMLIRSHIKDNAGVYKKEDE